MTAAAIGGCSSKEPDGVGGIGGAGGSSGGGNSNDAYLFATNVADGDSSNTYVLVLSELEGELQLDHALEVPGNSSIFTELGAIFVANSKT